MMKHILSRSKTQVKKIQLTSNDQVVPCQLTSVTLWTCYSKSGVRCPIIVFKKFNDGLITVQRDFDGSLIKELDLNMMVDNNGGYPTRLDRPRPEYSKTLCNHSAAEMELQHSASDFDDSDRISLERQSRRQSQASSKSEQQTRLPNSTKRVSDSISPQSSPSNVLIGLTREKKLETVTQYLEKIKNKERVNFNVDAASNPLAVWRAYRNRREVLAQELVDMEQQVFELEIAC
jgi:hypothetical protein